MLLMLLAILFSAVLTLLFKLFGHWRVNIFHAIVVNYFTAVGCGVLFSGKWPFMIDSFGPGSWLAFIIGCFFILGFNVLARTVVVYGVTIGTLMQKMSVILTICFAVFFFHEKIELVEGIGIFLAMVSIGMVTLRSTGSSHGGNRWSIRHPLVALPVLTFVTSACIDSLFMSGQKLGWVTGTDAVFIASIFLTAGTLGLFTWLIVPAYRGIPERKSVFAGILLGIPNYFSIYFLLEILGMGWDGSVVFPIFNVGVLLCSALMGALLLREEMPPLRLAGVALAALSIYLISSSV